MKTRATTLYPFVPSGTDFELAKRFFEAIGFEKAWEEGSLAGLRCGGAYFLLQHVEVPEWQKNQTITVEVGDVDAYWCELEPKNLGGTFAGVKVLAPTQFPWGREVHIVDPAGVCWHFAQSKSTTSGSSAGERTGEFPAIARSGANRIATASQFTDNIEGYVFDGADGSQVALWTARADGTSAEHAHDFDEYIVVLEGECAIILGERRVVLRAGGEFLIARGTRQRTEVIAGTRTMHVFGGRRAERAR